MKKQVFLRWTVALLVCTFLLPYMTTSAVAAKKDPGLPLIEGEVEMRLPTLFAKPEEVPARLQVGGGAFGVRLFTEGVLIVGVADQDSPAARAGLLKRDRILSVNGEEVRSVEDIVSRIENCAGKALSLKVARGDQTLDIKLKPKADENGKYRAGIWVRDNAAGIGTVTFIDPKTGAFGGLGHGICDADTGELLPLSRGAVIETEINGVVRGAEGTPGELRGYLGSRKIGTLLKNCDRGVFGILTPIPDGSGEACEIGGRKAVHAGDAFLRCTLDDGEARDYRVELSDIHPDNMATKCFAVHVTDPDLIARTGGIVQGMSGSPILQDGKLVGAVTHVLIGDPTRGYGIFIENMIDAMPDELGL